MKSIVLINAATTDRANVSQAAIEEFYLPASLLYLSGTLSQHYTVEVLDLNTYRPWNLPQDGAAEALIKHETQVMLQRVQPFVIGISSLFSKQIKQVITLAKWIKSLFPHTPIVIGGIHPTIFSEEMMREVAEIDYIIQAEGEESTLQLMKALEENSSLEHIDGLTYRSATGEIINQAKKHYIKNIDTIARPAYHLFDFEKYKIDTSRWYNPKKKDIGVPMPFLTSRSCPNQCNFCCMYRAMGPGFRAHSAAHVVDEIEFLYKEYGINYFEIIDDNFTLHKRRTLEICNGIVQRNLDIQIRSLDGLAANTLDDEVIDALAAAGLIWASIAIESGSEFIRNKVMGKRLETEKIFQVCNSFLRYEKIILTALFIIGMPEDTHETLQETSDLITALPLDNFSINNATPFPGTALYETCYKDGLLEDPAIGRWDYEGAFTSNSSTHFFIKPYNMTLDELVQWRYHFNDLRLRSMSERYRAISRFAMDAASDK